jgi:hypothetical protein
MNRPIDAPLHPVSSDYNIMSTMPDMRSFEEYNEPVLLDYSYLYGQADGSMSYNLLDMPREMYETFSQIEPLSVIMDPGFDLF